jgi:putative nucleotidyltransferase with HDIG domain
MSTAPAGTPANPLDLQDMIREYCFEVLAKTIHETKCRSGWLILLADDGMSPKHVFANIKKHFIHVVPPRLEPAWAAALQAGLARTLSNTNPFTRRVIVPYYSGYKPALLYVLAGRFRPFNADDIAHIASLGKDTWGELERMRYISQLEQAYEMTIQGWARSVEERERTSAPGHYHLPAEWAAELGRALHLSETAVNHLRRGAVLHDIGKMSIPENILQKSGALSPEEWAIVRRHPILGAEMVAETLFLSAARDVILYHHERWDGKGYPHGLKGEEIPLLARIFSVVDVFDALIVDRPYSPAWPRDMALAYIRQEAGQQFDPGVVAAFITIVKKLRM